MAINLEKNSKINLRKRVSLEKSGLGKYAGVHGVIRKSEIAPAKPVRGVVGKVIGKNTNFPMDSDHEFEKRVKRYERERMAAAAAMVGTSSDESAVVPASKLAVVPA